MGLNYRWRELEVFTLQTFSNILTFIQFASMPLAYIDSLSKNDQSNFKKILTEKFNSLINIYLSPLDFINKYNQIVSPVQSSLSITIIIVIISFLSFHLGIFSFSF